MSLVCTLVSWDSITCPVVFGDVPYYNLTPSTSRRFHRSTTMRLSTGRLAHLDLCVPGGSYSAVPSDMMSPWQLSLHPDASFCDILSACPWYRQGCWSCIPDMPPVGGTTCNLSSGVRALHRLHIEYLVVSALINVVVVQCAIHCTVHSINVAIQYTLLLVSNTTVVQWPCTVFGYTGRLVIQ